MVLGLVAAAVLVETEHLVRPAVAPGAAVVEALEEAGRGRRDLAGDLADLPAVMGVVKSKSEISRLEIS